MYLDDIRLHMELTVEPVRIEKEKVLLFSRNFDPFRLHCDEEYAKSTRFGRLVAPGVMSFMSFWTEVIESGFFGDELIAGKSTHIEWFAPVFVDDVLTGKCRVTNIRRRNAYNGVLELTTHIYNQDGVLVLTNVTETIVKYRTE